MPAGLGRFKVEGELQPRSDIRSRWAGSSLCTRCRRRTVIRLGIEKLQTSGNEAQAIDGGAGSLSRVGGFGGEYSNVHTAPLTFTF